MPFILDNLLIFRRDHLLLRPNFDLNVTSIRLKILGMLLVMITLSLHLLEHTLILIDSLHLRLEHRFLPLQFLSLRVYLRFQSLNLHGVYLLLLIQSLLLEKALSSRILVIIILDQVWVYGLTFLHVFVSLGILLVHVGLIGLLCYHLFLVCKVVFSHR